MERGALLAACLVGALIIGCGETRAPRDVVLISIDTLRADHLGLYGDERPTSPGLDRVAASGAVFLDVSTTSPWTLPSHASLLTGLYPNHHGVKDHVNRLSDSIPTLASILGGHGYQTFAVINSHNLSPRYGLDRGFEDFDYVHEWNDESGAKRKIVNRGDEITDRAIAWLKGRNDQPFFLFLHYYDVHSAFDARPEFRELFVRPYRGRITGESGQLDALRRSKARLPVGAVRHLVDLYDAEIRQLDATLQRLFDFLRDAGLDDDLLLIVTSDHGEEFMEHGSLLHGRTYFQEVTRVPLIIRGAGVPKNLRIDQPVSLIDVAPTILGLLSLGAPAAGAGGFDGIDLSPYMASRKEIRDAVQGQDAERLLFAEGDHGNEEPDMKRMVRQGAFKLVRNLVTGTSRLHDLRRDPAERVDIRDGEAERVVRLELALEAFMEGEIEPDRIEGPDADALELLEQLGYVR
jgi:arylsulfatase A-like enzyme